MFAVRSPARILCQLRRMVHTNEVIKIYQKGLEKGRRQTGLMQPRTYEQQIQLINNPQIVKYIEVVEYGVVLPKTNKWVAALALVVAVFLYAHYETLPLAIVERYMSISQQIDRHPVGYLGSFLTFSGPSFYVYLPLLTVINHSTRYIKYYWPLLLVGLLANSHLGKYLANKDLQDLEVWNRTKISYGEGVYMLIGFALWGFLGFRGGLGAVYGSRMFLSAEAGVGIVNKGIPIGIVMMLYTVYEAYRMGSHSIPGGRSELIFSSALIGALYGVMLRRLNIRL